MPLPCPLTQAVAAYLLEDPKPEERERFQQHLRVCIACRREVDDLTPVVDLLLGLRSDRDPPG